MILIDKALEKLQTEGKPIKVGMIGAGFMASGTILEIVKYRQGIVLVGIANRNSDRAKEVFNQAGIIDITEVSTLMKLNRPFIKKSIL